MTYNPSQPLGLLVELQINGVWTAVTSRARAASQVNITAGKSQGATQGESSRLSCVIGNPDGWLTEDNPLSPWYPYVGRGCPIRVSITGVNVSPVVRFFGAIDTMVAVNPGGPDATMTVTAVGMITQLGRGQELKSPMTRTMTGVSAGGYVPYASWAMEDPSGSTRFASDLADGSAIVPVGTVDFASNSSSLGSLPLPVFGDGGTVVARLASYVDTGHWFTQFMMFIPAAPAAETVYAEIRTTATDAGPMLRLSIAPGTPSTLHVRRFDSTNTQLVDVSHALDGTSSWPTEAGFYGSWAMIGVGSVTSGATFNTYLSMGVNAVYGSVIFTGASGVATQVNSVRLFGNATNPPGFGHLAVYTDPALVIGTGDAANVAAMNGYAGEFTADRLVRLRREEAVAITGGVSGLQRMGPQGTGTLLADLYDIEAVDQGILHDQSAIGSIVLEDVFGMCNQSPALAITTDALEPDPGAVWDNQLTANDVTSSRPGGSSARLSDEANVAKRLARIPQTPSVNVYTDDQLVLDAGWRLNIGTAAGPRVPALGMNLRNDNAAKYASQVLAVGIGSRVTVAASALPPQYPPGGLDVLVMGWIETLDALTWLWRPVVVPYAPYLVAVYGTDRYDSAASTLMAGVSSSATALQVFNATNIWTTDPAQFPFDVKIAGERMTASAIASSITDSFTRTTSSGWGTPTTTPGPAWTVAAGVTASIMSTNGSVAAIAAPQSSSYDPIMLIDTGSTTWDVKIRVKTRANPVGGSCFDGLIAGYQNANNLYYLDVQTATTGVVTANIARYQAAVFTTLASVPVPQSLAVGDLWLRVSVNAASGLLSLKVWQDGATEPYSWTLQVTDTTFTSTLVGVYAYRNGTTPTSQTYDDFAVLNPQTFTVTRAVNGIAKAQTAGSAVALANTPRYAH